MPDMSMERRDLLLAPLLAAFIGTARASTLDPTQTVITMPDQIVWETQPGWPPNSNEQAKLFGELDRPGLYYRLVKWYPGYMSGPHTYVTDRLCVIVSGTWWVNSGADFDPTHCIPLPAGTFIRRVAHTPHYDGVVAGGKEPAVIAICGMAPVNVNWLEADKPGWRKV
jgi:hypothetical protein